MGYLITFWSPYAGHGKVTSSLCAVLGGSILQYPELSVAISHTQNEPMTLLKKLDRDVSAWERKGVFDAFGIDALKVYDRQNAVSSEIIRRCGLPVYGRNVYFYPNFTKEENGDIRDSQIMINLLKREFEVVFLDLESGREKEKFQYMQEADYVVVVLPQEKTYVERFLNEEAEKMNDMRYGIVFGGYYFKSQYSTTYYKKLYSKKLKDRILGEILWNKDYFDAMSDGKVMDFFWRNHSPVKKEENYEFIVRAKKTAAAIRKRIICF